MNNFKYWHFLKTSILWGAFCFLYVNLHASDSDGLNPDSTRVKMNYSTVDSTEFSEKEAGRFVKSPHIDTIKPQELLKKPHSPQRATILSAVVPGLGQIYNHKYWKVPFIYAGGAGLFYYYHWRNERYIYYKEKYEDAVALKSTEIEYYRFYLNSSSKSRTYAMLYIGFFYAANVVDALADAYFFEYDINDNLALKIQPQFLSVNNFALNGNSCGIRLSLTF